MAARLSKADAATGVGDDARRASRNVSHRAPYVDIANTGTVRLTWHLDEFYVKINRETNHLWCAVGHEGEILESFVTKTRVKQTAPIFMKKALKRHGSPEMITTDGLRACKAAMTELGNAAKQEIGRWANNRAENSHPPFRRRARAMLRFRQMKTLQKFASVPPQHRRPFQSGTPSRQSSGLQASPLGSSRRVANPHGLAVRRIQDQCVTRDEFASD